MVSVFTPNVQLEEPARGDYPATWDLPVNSNYTVIDLLEGGSVTISGLTNASVVLSAPQFQCRSITLSGALTGAISITFPSSFRKPYTILNQCTNSSNTVTLTNGA